MRVQLASALSIAACVAAGVAAPSTQAQLPKAKYCGKLVVLQNQRPGEGPRQRVGGYLTTRGLSCRLAKITARNIASQYRGAQGYVVRRNTLDCDSYPGYILDCVGIRPGDEDPTIAFALRLKRR